MSDGGRDWRVPDVRRVTGFSALVVAVAMAFEAVRQLIDGGRPGLDEPDALAEYFERTANGTLVVVLSDTILMTSLIVFLGCFRQLVTTRTPGLSWVADIGFGAGLVYVAVTLVGDAMTGGAGLDASGGDADPVIIRALIEGHMLLFGAIGCILTAVVMTSAGFLVLASRILPRWTGVFAFVAAGLNLLAVPTMFGGTDETSLFSVGGWANAVLAVFPFLLWVVLVGVFTVRGRERHEQWARRRRGAVGALR
ncbi:hypothetical protein [Protaetiibacter larvae]|uniref:DUF4386 family protein n=1 Tax=Protaetiibacter larvae TaxID=2592654 RepID=A0A5C1Y714_9MICO|nr:hypothetical protein [Protaetiibacter larvae]QEO09596.1 hypothetical protein FLP23_06015 [Protaetiibacter larvae]